ncbi:hypothetical protein QJS83_13535 [Bdellovibrio sp. 22V]|uniref:hypothetical protein n=1 Tax=Bdellovibrio TaxID=958 RepID=UPI0025433FC0|nr:hypothetical protein [Bdellovibrio sp. 22V]WII71486.1 hypothetical protein QJS83_13535 [Bdellovibrio sp. 22V]
MMMPFFAKAQETVSFTVHHFYQSVRALGMGDAFVAINNDESSFYYNPASLYFSDQKSVSLSLDLGASPDTVDFVNDINDIQSSSGSETDKQGELIDLLTRNYGNTYTVRTKLFEVLWNREDWAFGFIPLDTTVEATLHQQVGPAVNTTIFGDTSITAAKGGEWTGLLPGTLGWGVSGKIVNRLYFSEAVSASELAANENVISREDISEGYTFDFDAGLLWALPESEQGATVGLVIRNILNLGFKNSFGLIQTANEIDPEPLHRVVDVGYSMNLPAWGEWQGRWAFDARDIGHPNINWKKMTHLGVEIERPFLEESTFAVRAGFGELLWSAGFTARFGFFSWDFATYAENVGTLEIDQDSRLYITKFKFIF